jgi:hypothetical protein
MNEQSAETRYGAFRALTTMDDDEPFVKGELLNDQFKLHVVDTDGPPMVHLTNRRKAEVVLFGSDQRLTAPLTARAGRYIVVKAVPGRDEVVISRFKPGEPDLQETVSCRVADVLRTIASVQFKASFPDVAQFLVQADQQGNLPSRLEVDALPKPGRFYERPEQGDNSKARIGNPQSTPNLFDTDEEEESEQPEATLVESSEPGTGMASFADNKAPVEGAEAVDAEEEGESKASGSMSKFNPMRLWRKSPPAEAGDSE